MMFGYQFSMPVTVLLPISKNLTASRASICHSNTVQRGAHWLVVLLVSS